MHVETVIVGAGQAGLALSHSPGATGREHVVLERGRIGERWRSERWDSLHLLTPNWLNRLPGAAALSDPDGYLDRRGVGELVHRQGVTAIPGLFALGLRFQRTRRSHFIGGVGDDAALLARAIVGKEPAASLERIA